MGLRNGLGMASSSRSRRARLVLVRELIRSLQFRWLESSGAAGQQE
ncbi:hypothetical protein Hdeb2414_s0017g00503981 [Helianthus debilis subsp. tardiflorus]